MNTISISKILIILMLISILAGCNANEVIDKPTNNESVKL